LMADPEPKGLRVPIPPSVPDLVGEFQQQQEAWQQQALELARLRSEVMVAAEREAVGIVTMARADIRRIIVAARRELLGLAAQIEVITETLPDAGAAGYLPAPGENAVNAPVERGCATPVGALLPAEAGAHT